MKKFVLALIASASIITANAQSNSWLLYGNVSVKADSVASTVWTFTPGIGYQFNDNWTVGINLSWSQHSLGLTSTGNPDVMNSYWGGPFVRYTHTMSNMFSCFAQADVSYMGQYETPGSSPSVNKGNGFGVNVWPAIAVHVGHGCALNFSLGGLGYSSMTVKATDNADGVTHSNLAFNFGKTMMIGFSMNFGGSSHHHGVMEPGAELHKMDTKDDDK